MKLSIYSKVLLLPVLAISLGISACSSTPEKDEQTKKAQRPLEVPPDLSSLPPEDSLSSGLLKNEATYSKYSEQTQQKNRREDPIVKISKRLLPEFEAIKIYKAGSQHWLVVKSEAEPLWFSIRKFIQLLGFEITIQTPETGVMQTNWKENKPLALGETAGFFSSVLSSISSTGLRDQFRIRLERGDEPGTMEVFVSHQGMEEVLVSGGYTDVVETLWQPRASDPELEIEVLRLLMVHLGTQDEASKTIAKEVASLEKIQIKKNEDKLTILWMGESLDRAWRRVGLSLDRIYFTVQDRDRTTGVYYVRYFDPNAKKKKGFFSSLIGDDEPTGPQHYQVALKEVKDGTIVEIRDKAGDIVDNAVSRRILNLLYEQLI